MIRVIVYTTGDACMQCRLTKRALDAVGLEYVGVDLTDPSRVRERNHITRDFGYTAAPVVEVDGVEHWSGFHPDRIKDVAARLAAAPQEEEEEE